MFYHYLYTYICSLTTKLKTAMHQLSVNKLTNKAYERSHKSVNLDLPVHGFNPDSEDYVKDGENEIWQHYKLKDQSVDRQEKSLVLHLNH